MAVEIDCPAENDDATVVVEGSATTGFISARGQAFDPGSRAPLMTVHAVVYQGDKGPHSPEVPLQHPPGATPGNVTGPNSWFFPDIGDAPCTGGGGVLCTLVVWASFAGVPQELRGFRHFQGVCGSEVSCQPE
jgi:hypothetical protein